MLRIVIIEDNIKLAQEMAASLAEDGHNAIALNESPDLMKTLRKFIPDLMIINVLIPGIDAFTVISEMRRQYPGVRIIAITAGGNMYSRYYLQAVKSLGVHFTLKKPFRIEHLKQMINFMLNGKALLTETLL